MFALRRLHATLTAVLMLHRTRARLAMLDDHLLRDIGLTRAEAAAEAARPVWDAPGHWQAAPGKGASNMNVSVGNA
jgi:uncharacterized protein YjiS (DUF1127 family)